MPTISGTMIAAAGTTTPDCGSSKPIALKAPVTSWTKPNPSAMPAIEARIPSSSASSTTLASTCREEAPSVRSIPNSRVRWATVIENVLKIRKAPTNTEIPANDEQRVVRKREAVLDVGASSSAACCSPVFARTSAGSAALIRSRSSSGVDPLGGLDVDLVVALLAGDPLDLVHREDGEARAAERHPGAEPADPRERVVLGALEAADRDRVADLVALLLGGDRVDRDLVVGAPARRPR